VADHPPGGVQRPAVRPGPLVQWRVQDFLPPLGLVWDVREDTVHSVRHVVLPALLGPPSRDPLVRLDRRHRNPDVLGEQAKGFFDGEQLLAGIRLCAASIRSGSISRAMSWMANWRRDCCTTSCRASATISS
jgi:hypothetical protein